MLMPARPPSSCASVPYACCRPFPARRPRHAGVDWPNSGRCQPRVEALRRPLCAPTALCANAWSYGLAIPLRGDGSLPLVNLLADPAATESIRGRYASPAMRAGWDHRARAPCFLCFASGGQVQHRRLVLLDLLLASLKLLRPLVVIRDEFPEQ